MGGGKVFVAVALRVVIWWYVGGPIIKRAFGSLVEVIKQRSKSRDLIGLISV